MKLLVATKSLTYATRRFKAGDEFEAKPRDARLLIAIGKAKAVREVSKIAPPPPEVTLAALRAEYELVIGRRPFMGWGADMLRAKISDARKR